MGKPAKKKEQKIPIPTSTLSIFREISKDVFYYIPAQIVPLIAGFLGLVAYTRLLNPDQYGFYIITITTVTLISALTLRWIGDSSLRFLEEYKNRAKLSQFISTSCWAFVFCFIIVAVILLIVTLFLEKHLNPALIYLLRIGVILLGVKAGYSLIISIIRSERRTLPYAIYSSLNAFGALLLAVILLRFAHMGPEGIILAMIIIGGGIFGFELLQFHKRWKINFSSISPSLLRELASYGLPLVGVALGALILAYSDRYMIGYFLDSEAVGIYSAGYDISDKAIRMFFSVLIAASYPVIIQFYERCGEEETRELLKWILSVYFILLTPAVLGIAALSEDIVNILLGAAFQKAYIILPWVAVGVFFLGLTQIANKPFELKKKTIHLLFFLAVTSIVNIGLNLFFIPKLGIRGAALSTLISYFLYLVLSWSFSTQFFKWIFPLNSFVKIIFSAAIMFVILFFIPDLPLNFFMLLLKVFIGLVVYVSLLILVKEKLCFSLLKYLKERLLRRGYGYE